MTFKTSAKFGAVLGLVNLLAGSAFSQHGGDKAVEGNYFIPVTGVEAGEPGLQNFKMDYRVRENSSGAVSRIRYTLPREVVGVKNDVSLRADPQAPGGFVSSNADATCVPDAQTNGTQCKLIYKNLKIDSVAVESFIRANYPNASEQEARIALAKAWSTEPIGILTIPGVKP